MSLSGNNRIKVHTITRMIDEIREPHCELAQALLG
jgi:hypothetical protein